MIKEIEKTMVPVADNEYPYEMLAKKILYKTASPAIGCFKGWLPRANSWGGPRTFGSASCMEHCAGKGFAYAGLTLGGICDCGEKYETMKETEMEKGCNVQCAKFPEPCGKGANTLIYNSGGGGDGGGGKIDLYQEAKDEESTMCDG